ncbi:glucose dehydrogenase [FAD, quinone]-like isoform X1 [Ornithodoros turicata]|uniref:glucose dehydrogenase [FAD, quinone]-like isoform X1 n=1 Tax=Ornithodoros turicata TaxID=34597 RepID=UPI0031395814
MIPAFSCAPKGFLLGYIYVMCIVSFSNTPSNSYYDRGNLKEEYDFIVVGSGSAGSVVANRLSAVPHVSVLLIEAGNAPDAETDVPFLSGRQMGGKHDWYYKTVPQTDACLGMVEHRSTWNRGKALGGTSVINSMMFVRGNRLDFDNWAANGATGWTYDEVLPYFKSIETFTIPEYADNGYHGDKGELTIGYAPSMSLSGQAFLDACKELGYDEIDYNGPTQSGCSRVQFNIKGGRRETSSKTFLSRIIKRRPNLHITLGSTATKIQFDGKQAVGVHFEKHGTPHFIRAAREVILSAGAIASPQLLMLSGVGPKKHLQELEIPVVADLPVGQNLQDHTFTGGIAATLEYNATIEDPDVAAYTDYCLHGNGPLAIPAGIEALSMLSTSFVNTSTESPDVELTFVGVSPSTPAFEAFLKNIGYKNEVYEKYYMPNRGRYAIHIAPCLNKLKSRGEIKLKSTNPHEHPLIDPKYFSHPEDILVAIEAAKKTLEVIDTNAMKALGAKRWDISLPGCEDKVLYSDEYLECLIRHLTHTVWHYSGTCAMGTDNTSVVDARLRVRGGVTNLRVIDASIMPVVTTGNTNAPTMMIGAKGAAMVLEDNGLTVGVE